jgi:malonyl-CoA decarboxylase
MNTSFFGELLQTISDRGRALLDRGRDRRGATEARSESLVELCEHLLSGRGEASGVARARDILTGYDELTTGPRIAFFEALAKRFGADAERTKAAFVAWEREPGDKTAAALHAASEPRRQELFRRLNLAPGGTAALVRMREHPGKDHPLRSGARNRRLGRSAPPHRSRRPPLLRLLPPGAER